MPGVVMARPRMRLQHTWQISPYHQNVHICDKAHCILALGNQESDERQAGAEEKRVSRKSDDSTISGSRQGMTALLMARLPDFKVEIDSFRQSSR